MFPGYRIRAIIAGVHPGTWAHEACIEGVTGGSVGSDGDPNGRHASEAYLR